MSDDCRACASRESRRVVWGDGIDQSLIRTIFRAVPRPVSDAHDGMGHGARCVQYVYNDRYLTSETSDNLGP